MRRSGKLEWVLVILALITCVGSTFGQTAPSEEKFRGWPAGWITAYQRFENYIAARRASWPRSNLHISEEGMISHHVRLAESRKEHLSLRVFWNGRNFLTMGLKGDLLAQGREAIFAPGTYAACLYASGLAGYQHVYPIVWFDLYRDGESGKMQIRSLSENSEEFWPNERLFLFLDFHVFYKRHPWDIEKRNRKVRPTISLRLNNDGVIERESLDDAAERLLRWRIYHNGKLVEKGSAAGVNRYESRFGPGTYQVFVGIEGNNGFMPVSNLLEYPLFPGVGGKDVVEPPDENRDGVPDFLEKITVRGRAEIAQTAGSDLDGDGLTDEEEEGGGTRFVLRPKDPSNQAHARLIELWRSWEYDLKERSPLSRQNDNVGSELDLIPERSDLDEKDASLPFGEQYPR